jgi:hypothetical protein
VAVARARTQAGECGSDYLTDVTVVGERAVSAVGARCYPIALRSTR